MPDGPLWKRNSLLVARVTKNSFWPRSCRTVNQKSRWQVVKFPCSFTSCINHTCTQTFTACLLCSGTRFTFTDQGEPVDSSPNDPSYCLNWVDIFAFFHEVGRSPISRKRFHERVRECYADRVGWRSFSTIINFENFQLPIYLVAFFLRSLSFCFSSDLPMLDVKNGQFVLLAISKLRIS